MGISSDDDRATAAEPVVSALRDGIPNAMYRYRDAAIEAGETDCTWAISEPLAQELSGDGPRISNLFGWRVEIHDEWSWGWMLLIGRRTPLSNTYHKIAFELPAQGIEAPQGVETTGSTEGESPVRQDAPKSPNQETPHDTK